MIDPTNIHMMVPEATSIDYSDAEEICGYQMLLAKLYEKCGGFSHTTRTDGNLRHLDRQAEIWLRGVRQTIDGIFAGQSTSLTLGNIPELLASYKFVDRLYNGKPSIDYLKRVRLATVKRWIKGDTSIPATDAALLIAEEIRHDIHNLDDRYSTYYFQVEERWVDELMVYGRFKSISLREAYVRLRALFHRDLYVYLGSGEQRGFKQKLVETYRLTDFSGIDTITLWAYIGFMRTATRLGFSTCDDPDEQYVELFSTLSTRPDLHPFYKQAIAIDLERYVALA